MKDPLFRPEVPFELGCPLGPPGGVKEHETGTFKRRVTGSYLIKIRTGWKPLGNWLSSVCKLKLKAYHFKHICLSENFKKFHAAFKLILLEIQKLQRYPMTKENKCFFFSLIIIQYLYSPYVTVVFFFFSSLCPAIYGHEVSKKQTKTPTPKKDHNKPSSACNFSLKCLCHSKFLKDL